MRLVKFAHVTYLAHPSVLQSIRNNPASNIVLDARAVPVPKFKIELCGCGQTSQDMLLVMHRYTLELLSNSDMPDSTWGSLELPSRFSTATSDLEIRSSSFTQATLHEFAGLFGGSPGRDSLRLELPLGCVTLVEDKHAPSFSESLCDGPGPVSIAFFCRGLDSFMTGREHSSSLASDLVTTPAGSFSVVLVRCGLVWFELLQRMERYVR